MLGNSLKNKKIVISAGASGIGWAITKICVVRGASVYLCDVDPKAINKVKKHSLYNKRIFVSETKIRLLYNGCFLTLFNVLKLLSHK